jgi:hypothetical protein
MRSASHLSFARETAKPPLKQNGSEFVAIGHPVASFLLKPIHSVHIRKPATSVPAAWCRRHAHKQLVPISAGRGQGTDMRGTSTACLQGRSERSACRWAMSQRGGRPRLGRSAAQSIGGSMRSQPTVSSVTTVFPPQAQQRRRRQAASGRAEGESAGRNRMGPEGGH